MITHQSPYPLLNNIVRDNPTFKFPIESIQKELMNMFISPTEYDYFLIQSYRKLKREYGSTVAHIFLSTLELKMKVRERDIYKLTDEEYQNEFEKLLQTLEHLYITRIDKKSSDGELMSAMV